MLYSVNSNLILFFQKLVQPPHCKSVLSRFCCSVIASSASSVCERLCCECAAFAACRAQRVAARVLLRRGRLRGVAARIPNHRTAHTPDDAHGRRKWLSAQRCLRRERCKADQKEKGRWGKAHRRAWCWKIRVNNIAVFLTLLCYCASI